MKMNQLLFPTDMHVPWDGRLHHSYCNYRKRDKDGGLWGYVTWEKYRKVIKGQCQYDMAHLKWTRL